MTNSNNNEPSFLKELWNGIVEGEKDALRFARIGAIVGAVLGGAGGFYVFEYLGVGGILAGFFGGAIILGIAAWLMYHFA